jgi:hypothetical protein
MTFKYLTLSLALAGLSGIASAADETFLDARLNLGIIPGIKSADGTPNGTIDFSAKTGFGAALGVEYGQYIEKEWGWVAGVSLIDGSSKGDSNNNGNDVKETNFGVQINAGGAYKINKEIHLELTPFIGIGRAKTTVEGNGGTSGTGAFLDYGITVAGFYTYNDHLQVGIDIGYEAYSAKSSLSFGPASYDISAKGGGFIAGLSLGYRF